MTFGPRTRIRLMLVIASVAFGAAVFVAMTGGVAGSLGLFTISIRSVVRPLLVGVLVTIAMLAGVSRASPTFSRARLLQDLLTTTGFGALLVCAAGMVLRYTVTACGGLDSYGYVSAAHLLLSGHVMNPEPMAHYLPFDDAIRAVAPIAYRPAPAGDAIVPEFPLGLPFVMAAYVRLFGNAGAFYVAPTLAIGATVVAYVIARRLTSPAGAMLAAALVSTNPVLVNSAIQPMSDVPAAFWILVSVWGAWRPRPRSTLAGLSAGLAVWTRPPLLLAACVIGSAIGLRKPRSLLGFAAGLFPLVAALLLLQYSLYGHPFVSGHGSSAELFSVSVLGKNLANHTRWLLVGLTPALPVGFFLAYFRGNREFALFAGALFAAVAAPYLLYTTVFTDWEILRFLLPGLLPLGIVCADGFIAGVSRTRLKDWTPAAALTIAIAAAVGSYSFLARHFVFDLWRQESKYPLVGAWFHTQAGPDAVVMADLHSGSIRYYSGNPTLRWIAIPSDKLDDTVNVLQQRGYRCYVALDGADEAQAFRRRFPDAAVSGLRMSPEARVKNVDIVRLEPRKPGVSR